MKSHPGESTFGAHAKTKPGSLHDASHATHDRILQLVLFFICLVMLSASWMLANLAYAILSAVMMGCFFWATTRYVSVMLFTQHMLDTDEPMLAPQHAPDWMFQQQLLRSALIGLPGVFLLVMQATILHQFITGAVLLLQVVSALVLGYVMAADGIERTLADYCHNHLTSPPPVRPQYATVQDDDDAPSNDGDD